MGKRIKLTLIYCLDRAHAKRLKQSTERKRKDQHNELGGIAYKKKYAPKFRLNTT